MNKPINILVVSSKYPPEYAGSGLRVHRTYKRLKDKFAFNYRVLCGSVSFNKREEYEYEGVWVHRIACKIFKNIKNEEEITKEFILSKIIRKLKNGVNYFFEAMFTWAFLAKMGSQFNIIHVIGNNHVTAAVLLYAKIIKKPLIIEICNNTNKVTQYEPWFIGALFGKGIRNDSKIVCISKRIENSCLKEGYKDNIWCRPNPVDSSRFNLSKGSKVLFRKKLNLFSENDIVLLNVAKFYPLKNQSFLIDVLKRLPEQYKLIIAGPLVDSGPNFKRDTEYFKELKDKIMAFGLSGRVNIKNKFIDNVDEYMKASDIYLLPSKIEACATPIFEALLCGVPVVAHSIDGVTTEWIENGINGFLAPLKIEEFKDAIIKASLLDQGALEKSAENIKKNVSTEYIDKTYADSIRILVEAKTLKKSLSFRFLRPARRRRAYGAKYRNLGDRDSGIPRRY